MIKPSRITPHLWFDKEAGEAAGFYVSIFPDSKITNVTTLHDTPAGSVEIVSFELSGQPFQAISAGPTFKFNEAISFMVHCDDQKAIDYYWDRLGAGGDPAAQQCGWLKDRYGLSWQIVPAVLDEMMRCGDQAKIARITQAFLEMKKFDLAALTRAFEGR